MAYQNELYHYGTLGMKWGIRRYQNKDGSLTPAGKKRYAKLNSELEKLKPPGEKTQKSSSKTASGMTDDELRTAINRLRMESEYKQLVSSLSPKKVQKGESLVVKAGKYAVKKVFDTFVAEAAKNKNSGEKKSNKKPEASETEKANREYEEGNKRLKLQMERAELKRKKKAQNEQYKEEDREKRAYRKATRTTDPYNPYWLY